MMQKLKRIPKIWITTIKWRNKKTPRVGHVVLEFYPDLKEVKHDDPGLQSAVKLRKRCYEQVIDNERKKSGGIDVEPSKSKYWKPGGGRKITIPNV